MDDADRATRPRCGAPPSADDAPGVCSRCLPFDAQCDQSEMASRSSLPGGPASLKSTLASTARFVVAILFGWLGFGNKRGNQRTDAEAHFNCGVELLREGKLDGAIAACREAIRIKPDYAKAHYNLGITLKAAGKLTDAVAEFRTARDNARPGSKLSQATDLALTALDH
jgi:tetratricopeptide (TPR) repeat protein